MTSTTPDNTTTVVRCPDCKAELGPEMRTCLQCGADTGLWPESQRTPLILPGNPALSVDVVRKKTSVPKVLAGTTLAAAIIGAVLYYMPEKDTEELPPLAASAPASDSVRPTQVAVAALPASTPAPTVAEPVTADSLAAFSYGDTALTRTVPSAAPVNAAPTTVAPAVTAPTVRSAAAPAPARPVPQPANRPATRVAAATPTVAPTRPSDAPSGVLAMVPVVSNTLRPGERLQLRWTVTDRRTREAIPRARVEFTSTDATIASVNPTSGLVTARTPGTARIIVDGGAAGQRTVAITVRAPAPSPVVTVAPPVVPDPARSPVATTPPVLATPTPAATPVRDAGRTDLPDASEIRSVVDRFIREVRRDAVRNFEVTQFLADGADHRVILVSGPNIVSSTPMGVRVAFEMRFTKFDGGGRPVTRVSSVSMDVDKRDGQPSSSAIAIGPLRRP